MGEEPFGGTGQRRYGGTRIDKAERGPLPSSRTSENIRKNRFSLLFSRFFRNFAAEN